MRKIYVLLLLIFCTAFQLNAQEWARSLSSTYSGEAKNIAVDASGNSYVVGEYGGTMTLGNGVSLSATGYQNGYLAKYNSNGVCLWAKSIGGKDGAKANCIAVDASGNSYVVGDYKGTMTLDNGCIITSNANATYESTGFVAKFDSNGISLWAKTIGGKEEAYANSVAADAIGNIYVVGLYNYFGFSEDSLSLGNGVSIVSGTTNGYIAKINALGECQWAKTLGGENWDAAKSVTVDMQGNSYVLGEYATTISMGNGISLTTLMGESAYIAKFNPNGTCQMALSIDATQDINIASIATKSIAVDSNGNFYIAGNYNCSMVFNNGVSLSRLGSIDGFVAKYNSSGICQWAKSLGSLSSNDCVNCIAVDGSNVVVGGVYSGTMNIGNGIILASEGNMNGFIVKFNSKGVCIKAQSLGSFSDGDVVNGIAVDASSNTYVVGQYSGTMPLSFGLSLSTKGGGKDGFLVKYDAQTLSIPSLFSPELNSLSIDVNTKLNWNADNDASGYKVQVATSENFSNLILDETITASSKELSGLQYNTKYFWRVRALKNSNASEWSAAWYFTTMKNPNAMVWAQSLAGTDENYAKSIVVDKNENFYVVGDYKGTISIGDGKFLTAIEEQDGYVAKYNSLGVCQWTQNLGSSGSDCTNGIVVDSNGNTYVVGKYSKSMILGNGISLTTSKTTASYIVKFNTSGMCQWALSVDNCNVKSIVIDSSSNNVYIVGDNGYVAKYNSNGVMKWSKMLGGSADNYADRIVVDSKGDLYAVGFYETRMDLGNGVVLMPKGSYNAFIAKFSSDGICKLGENFAVLTTKYNDISGLVVDANGNIYLSGIFEYKVSINNGVALTAKHQYCGFVAKVNSAGECKWIQSIDNDYPRNLALDANGNSYVVGEVYNDGFIDKYNSSGVFQWGLRIGGSESDYANSVAIDINDNIYIAGSFERTVSLYSEVSLNSEIYEAGYVIKYNAQHLFHPVLKAPEFYAQNIKNSTSLEWNPVNYATAYRVQVSRDYDFKTLLSDEVIAITSKELSSLSDNTQYYWRVKALNAIDSSEWSPTWNFSTAINPDAQFWAKNLGGSDAVTSNSVVVDTNGNFYVAGNYEGTISFGNGISLCGGDGYLAKYNSAGICQWAKSIFHPYSVTIDKNAIIYVVGGWSGGHLAKFNSDGICLWDKYFGDSDVNTAQSVTVDVNGNIYVAGYFIESISLGIGIYLDSYGSGDENGYIAKFDSAGNCLWAKSLGGQNHDRATSVAIDSNGDVYVVGYYWEKMYYGDNLSLEAMGDEDGFIIKYDSLGVVQWAKTLGSTAFDRALSVAVDFMGNFYIAGYIGSTMNLGNGVSLGGWGTEGGYIAKFNSLGECQWGNLNPSTSISVGGSSIKNVTADAMGNTYIVGFYNDRIYLDKTYTIALSAVEYDDGYVAKYNSIGMCQWAKSLGGVSFDIANSVFVDKRGDVYVAGNYDNTMSLDDGVSLTSARQPNGYVVKYKVFNLDSPSLVHPELNAQNVSFNTKLTWNSVNGAKTYKVQVSTTDDFKTKLINSELQQTSRILNEYGIKKNTKYYWRVLALGNSYVSDWSPTWSFTTTSSSDVENVINNVFSISPQPVRNEAVVTYSVIPAKSVFGFSEANAGISSGISVELYDLRGALVATYNFTSLSEGTNKLRLNVSNIPSGMYNVIIKSGAEVHQAKMIKVD